MEGEEVIYKIVALCIVAILIVVNYAAFVAASRADEEAEQMYRRWKYERGNSQADK